MGMRLTRHTMASTHGFDFIRCSSAKQSFSFGLDIRYNRIDETSANYVIDLHFGVQRSRSN